MQMIIQKNKINYEDKGKGFPIVFLPGITGKSDIWDNQIEHLSLYYRVICIDFSEMNINFISSSNLLNILHDIVKELGLNYFYIVGYSVGGLLALIYSNKYPGYIAGVVTTSLGNISASTNEVVKFYKKNFRPVRNLMQLIIDKFSQKKSGGDIAYKFASLIKYHTIMNKSPIYCVQFMNISTLQKRVLIPSKSAAALNSFRESSGFSQISFAIAS